MVKAVVELNMKNTLIKIDGNIGFSKKYNYTIKDIDKAILLYGTNLSLNSEFSRYVLNKFNTRNMFYVSYDCNIIKGGVNTCADSSPEKVIASIITASNINYDDKDKYFFDEQEQLNVNNMVMFERFEANNSTYVMQMAPFLIIKNGYSNYRDPSLLPFIYNFKDDINLNQFINKHNNYTVIYKYSIFDDIKTLHKNDFDLLKHYIVNQNENFDDDDNDEIKEDVIKDDEYTQPLLSDEELINLFGDNIKKKKPKNKNKKGKKNIKNKIPSIDSVKNNKIIDIVSDNSIGDASDIVSDNSIGDVSDIVSDNSIGDVSDIVSDNSIGDVSDIVSDNSIGDISDDMNIEAYKIKYAINERFSDTHKFKINKYINELYDNNIKFKNRMDDYNLIMVIKNLHYDTNRNSKSLHFNAKLINTTNCNTSNQYHFYIDKMTNKINSITEICNII
jgi:hypothetical protein